MIVRRVNMDSPIQFQTSPFTLSGGTQNFGTFRLCACTNTSPGCSDALTLSRLGIETYPDKHVFDLREWILHGDPRYRHLCVSTEGGASPASGNVFCPCSPSWPHRPGGPLSGGKFGSVCFLPPQYVGGGAGSPVTPVSELRGGRGGPGGGKGKVMVTGKPTYFRNHYGSQNYPHIPAFRRNGGVGPSWADEQCPQQAGERTWSSWMTWLFR